MDLNYDLFCDKQSNVKSIVFQNYLSEIEAQVMICIIELWDKSDHKFVTEEEVMANIFQTVFVFDLNSGHCRRPLSGKERSKRCSMITDIHRSVKLNVRSDPWK